MNFGIMGYGVVGRATADAARFHGHRLSFIHDPPQDIDDGDVQECDVVFICVPTPPVPGDAPLRRLDTSAVEAASRVLKEREYHNTQAIRSTLNIGDTDRISRDVFLYHRVIYNPEFLRRRDAEHTSRWPTYVVIGDISDGGVGSAGLAEFYEPYFEGSPTAPIFRVSDKTAEFYKLFSNAMIALTISAAHEMQALACELGADYEPVYHIAQHCLATPKTVRVDEDSPGWAGPCLPKDVEALCAAGRAAGVPLRALEHARGLNEHLRQKCGEGES